MNTTLNQQLSPWRFLWLIVLIGLPALGWYGVLDRFSAEDINASVTSAGVIYGTARGINALVSMLQGTELNIPFLTFSIGEVLDPVNDLIERFSDIIFFALGSLALQKILLAIVSKSLFNIVLTAIAVAAGISIVFGNRNIVSAMLRIFLVIAFIRFSLGLVVMANSWVDSYFLAEADQQRHAAMQTFEGELRALDTLSKKADEAAALSTGAQKDLDKLQLDRAKLKQSLEALNTTIEELEKKIKLEAEKAGMVCALSIHGPVLSPTCPESVKRLDGQLDGYRSNKEDLQSSLDNSEDAGEDMRDKIDCLQKRQQGETCHFWEVLSDIPNIEEMREKLNAISGSLTTFAENSINLLMSLLLKSVAIPILFFYLLLKIVRSNWAKI